VTVHDIALLGVPTSAGTHGPGQEKAPRALRAAGLVDRLTSAGVRVEDHGDLPAALFRADPLRRNAQNLDAVVETARLVSKRLRPLLDSGSLPVVLGGDCTITLGVLAAMTQRWDDAGLLYFDGDLDLSTPDTTWSGVLDTMVLTHVLGAGTEELRGIGPRCPLLPADRIVSFGHEPREVGGPQQDLVAKYGLRTTPCTELTSPGADPVAAARRAWATLAETAGHVVLHFDVDVIDSTELPLANFPHFNEGLPERIALDCFAEFCRCPGLAAVVITEINPDRDQDGTLLDRFVDAVVRALAGS
jgi:arginase